MAYTPKSKLATTLLALLVSTFFFNPAIAGPGHDHGDAPTPQPTNVSVPTMTAVSDIYEVVGTVALGQMTIYLDKTETNEPVSDAQIEVDFDGTVLKAEPSDNATFVLNIPRSISSRNSIPVNITVISPAGNDLLTGTFINASDNHSFLTSAYGIALLAAFVLLLAAALWQLQRKRPELFVRLKSHTEAIVRRFKA